MYKHAQQQYVHKCTNHSSKKDYKSPPLQFLVKSVKLFFFAVCVPLFTMKRIFGTSKPAPQGPSLDEAVQKVLCFNFFPLISCQMDSRVASLDEKIRKLDAELNVYKEKMKKTREGTAAHTQLKQRALKLLKQRKMYEGQREQLMGQQLNMEQANFASQTLKDTVTTVGAMKTANTSLKQQFKTVNIDDIDVPFTTT